MGLIFVECLHYTFKMYLQVDIPDAVDDTTCKLNFFVKNGDNGRKNFQSKNNFYG